MRRTATALAVLLMPLAAGAAPASSAPVAPAAVGAAGEVRFKALMFGNPAGQAVCRRAAGGGECDFEYNDRGRGPKLHEAFAVDAAGLPVKIEITGNDYLKVPVRETFSRTAQGAAWKNQGENGSAATASRAFYASFNNLPTDAALLVRALRQAPGNTLALLPAGEARLETLGERDVTVGKTTRNVTHVALHGLGFSPAYLWIDPDGGLFADTGGGWLAVVREGFESVLPELLAADQKAEADHFKALATRLAHHAAGGLVLHGARLFDPASGKVTPGTTIVIAGNRIQAVGADGAVPEPAAAERIDVHGRTVLPGLWDMHSHLSAIDGPLNIAAGVTSVRDMANDIDLLRELKTSWDAGTAVGPHVHRAGFIDGPGPYAGPSKVLVDNEKDALAWVDRYADLGYEQIKLYSSLKPELVPAIVTEAHRRGLRVSGHIPAFMTAEQCVRLGFDEIQHANFLFLNFFAKEVPDTRTPARFHAIGERAAGLDLRSQPVQDFIHLLRDRHVVSDPTLVAFEGMFQGKPGEVDPSFVAVAERLPPQVRRGFLGGGLQAPAGMEERYRQGFTAMLHMVGELYRNGVQIVAGTDSLAGFAYHRELELYVEAGIPATDILRIATLDAARVMKSDADEGSVAPGKIADLIVVDGDPTVKISDIRHLQLVIKDGVVYHPDEIDRAIGVKP